MNPAARHVALALVFGAVLWAAPPVGAMTLDEALALAAEGRPALHAARAREDAARAAWRERRAGRWPTLSLTLAATRMDDPAQSLFAKLSQGRLAAADMTPPEALNHPDPLTDLSAGVVLEQPLYTGGRVSAGIRAGRAETEAAEARREEAENATRAEVTAAYWGHVLAREALGVAERARDTARAHLALVERRVAEGAALRADRLAAEAHLAQTRRAVAARKRDVAIGRVVLEGALGLDALPSEPAEPLPVAPAPAAAQASLMARALAGRPPVAAAEAEVRAARAGLDAARGAFMPEVGLTASAADHRETLSGEAGQVWQVAARANWALADGGRRGAGVAAGRARLRQAEADRQRVRQEVRADVVAAYTLREAAREQLAAARTEQAAAEAALGLVRDRYAAGAGLFTELREAEDQLARAGLASLAARHDIAVAEADLRRAVGGDLGEEGP